MRATLIASAIGGAGCKKKEREEVAHPPAIPTQAVAPSPPSAPDPWPKPTDPPPIEPSFPIDKLIATKTAGPVDALVDRVREVARATSPEISVVKVSVSYVRKDGTLDPTYGKLDVDFALRDGPEGIVDDPNRPTGAPVPEVTPVEATRTECPTVSLAAGSWSATESPCAKTKLVSGPRCSVTSIWARALAQGAPDNAVAIVTHDARRGMWSFRITDKVRNVNFNRSYRDDCPPGGGSAAPPEPGVNQIKRNPYDR